MFLVLNRLRGTDGLWSKLIGLFLALVTLIVFHNHYVSVAVGLGYIIGESFGWGLWVGTLSVQRLNGYALHNEGEGRNNGIEWIASHIVKPTQDNWLNYCRVALAIRGFYWWLPTLAPLYFVGFNLPVLALMIGLLSIGFPLACELGYYFRDKVSFDKLGLSYRYGLELQEGFYGLMQDIVFIGGIVWHLNGVT